MQSNDRNKFLILTSFHLLWGLVLWFSISKLGLGLSTDSVSLLSGAQNLAESGRLVSFDGTPNLGWPPLYPALLAGIHVLTGLSSFASAHVLQVLAFAGQSVCVSLLFMQMFPDDFALALVGNILADVGVVVVAGFDLVGSDYLHFTLITLCCLLTGAYIREGSANDPAGSSYRQQSPGALTPRVLSQQAVLFTALLAASMFAMLTRYLGIAAILTSALAIVLWSQGTIVTRWKRGLVLLLAAMPAAVWLFMTLPYVPSRAPIAFSDNFVWFSRSILEWFLPPSLLKAYLALFIIMLWAAIAVCIVLALRARRARLSPYARPVLLFGMVYILALFGSAAAAYYNKLGGRFLLPLYVPFVTLLLLAVQSVTRTMQSKAARLAGVAVLGLAALLLLRTSLPAVLDSHTGASGVSENAFNTTEWRSNAALQYWLAHPPQGSYRLFSNIPDGVAFYTAHNCEPSPRQFSGPYGSVEFPVEGYAASLFTPGQATYLVWIEPNPYDYYYRPQDLAPIATVEELYTGADGSGVYRLTPKGP